MRRALVVVVAWLVVLAVGAVAPASAQGPAVSSEIVDFDFKPRDLTVPVGATVTWTNTGSRPHTVTDRGGVFDTDPVLPGRKGTVTFTVPGTYRYFCRINPGRMNGSITVTPGAEPARVNRIEALDPGRPGESLRFNPPNLTVEAGSTLVFANVGARPHTLTADASGGAPPAFDTGVVPPGPENGRFAGSNATFTLDRPGTFPFHCEVHPAAMRGTITVTGQARAGPAPAAGADRQASVEMRDFVFEPPEVSVGPGGEVTWRNAGGASHTATLDDRPLDTGVVRPGATAKLTAPAEPGSYSYRCNIHPGRMRGVLVVVGQNTRDPTEEAAARPAAAVGGGGPGGGVSTLALVTGVLGAFLGGFGLSAFVRGKPRTGPAPPAAAPSAPAEPPPAAAPPAPAEPPPPPAAEP